ncbi:hypothetical protein ACQRKX_001820 [Enterobacter cloacae]
MTFNIQAATLPADEIIAAIALATELRPRDGRDAVARRVYEQIVKPLQDELEATEKRVTELTNFVQHVNKCLLKNGEYSPLSHELIHTVLGIRASDGPVGVSNDTNR